MTYIKTLYGDNKTLKVILEKSKKDKYYNVIIKQKINNKWKIIEYYKCKSKNQGKKLQKKIYEKF